MKIVAENKKALFDYEILDRIEAGIVLTGDEVKSLRGKQGSLKGSFAQFHQGELMLLNANIPVYRFAYSKKEDETTRSRKLLLHKKELMRLLGEVSQRGITLVPLKIYFNNKGLAKVDIGIARHKKKADKKQKLKERDLDRETMRELKNFK
ncbi:TPA: SsrA-binding protein [Candidatus Dependentiae bacterium]|nr:MAG: SsrA-binding protein [candidate division TM6 bacterium GW2011_GWF2_36_131]KKQ03835.1 MAG: SsrA-binding protein [candidate division TM6 bacterium GW2011_GWE2_36_25]KKQ19456.1 MAG: SsrA-binding protein [candidate division TM6 bacterium GW2011_GWA2_36_9]HBR70603.1 SsrA-binding protein [Candidatus Dependentiae bacterium]HCU00682.1 SsrA-binding protein [Candidatus Dependentiae bacterium]